MSSRGWKGGAGRRQDIPCRWPCRTRAALSTIARERWTEYWDRTWPGDREQGGPYKQELKKTTPTHHDFLTKKTKNASQRRGHRPGKARSNKARGKIRQGKTGQDETRRDETRRDERRWDEARQDETRQGKAKLETTRHNKTRQDKTRQEKTRRRG